VFDTRPADLYLFPIGAVPKKRTDPPEWRRIHHLSHPDGDSINDHIDAESRTYARFDDAIRLAKRLGTGALFAKIDVKSAFRCIPVAPSDRHLLGFHWYNQFFADLCLPFGLSSSPQIWEDYASALHWIAQRRSLRTRSKPRRTSIRGAVWWRC
jgi:hypothetical protein